MTAVRVFVNERPVEVAAGAAVRAAVEVLDPALAEALDRGRAYATDGVGRPLDATAPVAAGAIVRVIMSARRAP